MVLEKCQNKGDKGENNSTTGCLCWPEQASWALWAKQRQKGQHRHCWAVAAAEHLQASLPAHQKEPRSCESMHSVMLCPGEFMAGVVWVWTEKPGCNLMDMQLKCIALKVSLIYSEEDVRIPGGPCPSAYALLLRTDKCRELNWMLQGKPSTLWVGIRWSLSSLQTKHNLFYDSKIIENFIEVLKQWAVIQWWFNSISWTVLILIKKKLCLERK